VSDHADTIRAWLPPIGHTSEMIVKPKQARELHRALNALTAHCDALENALPELADSWDLTAERERARARSHRGDEGVFEYTARAAVWASAAQELRAALAPAGERQET
jgi:hypothetical protein